MYGRIRHALYPPRETYVNLAAMLQKNVCLQNNFGLKPLSHVSEANPIFRTDGNLLQKIFQKSGLGPIPNTSTYIYYI